MEFLPLTLSTQFLSIHHWTVFGEGHRLVNWPMSPRSAKERAAIHGNVWGRSTSWDPSSFLTNLDSAGWVLWGWRDLTKVENASAADWEHASASGWSTGPSVVGFEEAMEGQRPEASNCKEKTSNRLLGQGNARWAPTILIRKLLTKLTYLNKLCFYPS